MEKRVLYDSPTVRVLNVEICRGYANSLPEPEVNPEIDW